MMTDPSTSSFRQTTILPETTGSVSRYIRQADNTALEARREDSIQFPNQSGGLNSIAGLTMLHQTFHKYIQLETAPVQIHSPCYLLPITASWSYFGAVSEGFDSK